MTTRLENALQALSRAYLEGTLFNLNCSACAVGNMIAYCNGYKMVNNKVGIPFRWKVNDKLVSPKWNWVFITEHRSQELNQEAYKGESKMQIDSTGYTWQELAKIEYLFETTETTTEDPQRERLQAILPLLFELDGLEYDQETERMFKPEIA